ncbi:MAG: hypothetical protein P4N24_07195 [Acidobacteriota bacterium]|nr:hypothetical protein [Acidobacteriota bacterium]
MSTNPAAGGAEGGEGAEDGDPPSASKLVLLDANSLRQATPATAVPAEVRYKN